MNNKIYITGHKNPDTDSIASALVYADLKNRIDKNNDYQAIRLGDLNLESKWVLDRWSQKPPKLVDSLKLKVEDLNLTKPLCINGEDSIYVAANYLQPKNRSFLPVTAESGKLEGIVTLSNLTKSYMDVWDDEILGRSNTSIENIVEAIAGEIVYLPKNPNSWDGRMLVYASNVDENGHVSKGDILIVGDRYDSQLEALERKSGVLIISSGHDPKEDILELAKKNNVTVLKTKYNSFMTARLLPQAVPVNFVMTKDDLITFSNEDFLDEVSAKVKNTRIRNFPIIDAHGHVIGQLNRNDLMFDKKKKVILVDHNEANQSIDDRDSVEILEIIDHHRVANINTSGPIYFRNEPVGCTSTILYTMYIENGITPSKEISGLMASAIISDTLLLRSPTTTETDKKVLHELAKIADIDLESYTTEMFAAGTSLDGISAKNLIMTDSKRFEISDNKCRVSQAFTTNLSSVEKMTDDIKSKLVEILNNEKLDMLALFITDIFNEKSLVFSVGDYNLKLAEEFNLEYSDNGYIVDGLLSRKKQFIPALTRSIESSRE